MASPTRRPLLLNDPASPLKFSPSSPSTPHTPLTPPLTPSSAITSDSNSSPAHYAISSPLNLAPSAANAASYFSSSSQLLRATKPNLPKIDTRKLAPSQQDNSTSTPLSYDLNSPTDAPLARSALCGDHFVVITGVPSTVQLRALHQTFQPLKGMKGIQTKHLQSRGIIALAFDDSRDAWSAFREIRRANASGDLFPQVDVLPTPALCGARAYIELFGTSSTVHEVLSELVVEIDLCAMDPSIHTTLDDELERILERGGEIRCFTKVSLDGNIVKYCVDYYKASDANSVMSRVDGQSITFGMRSGTIMVSRSSGGGNPSNTVKKDIKSQEGFSASDRSSSSDSLPTLSRRHSTTSFHQGASNDPPVASQTLAPNNSLRRLNHSVSERDLRKRSDSLVSDADNAPEREKLEEPAPPKARQPARSVLSPHARPFALAAEEQSHVSPTKSYSHPGAVYTPVSGTMAPPGYVQAEGYAVVPQDGRAATGYGGVYYSPNSYAMHPSPHPHLGSPIALQQPAHGLGLEMHHMYYVPSHQQHSYGAQSDHPLTVPHLVIGQGVLGSSHPSPSHPNYPHDPSTPRSLGSGRSSMDSPTTYSPTSMQLQGVPPRNTLDLDKIQRGEDTRTTVMLKNIPNKMSDKDLIAFISNVCPRRIDFLYLRMDFTNHCNVGYAFVNFIEVTDLLHFARQKLGTKWNMYSSEKVLQMSYANYQGKEALVEKFKNSCIMNEREEWRPKIFYSSGERRGLPEPFPSPTHLKRMERAQQTRGPLWGANGPQPPNDPAATPSPPRTRNGLWTRMRLSQSQGDGGIRRSFSPFQNPSPRHLASN